MAVLKNENGEPIGFVCTKDEIEGSPYDYQAKVEKSNKEKDEKPCPTCGSYFLDKIDKEIRFCVKCGNFSDANGEFVSAKTLADDGRIEYCEEGGFWHAGDYLPLLCLECEKNEL